MLTPQDVVRIAHEEGLADHADALVTAVRAGWRLEPAAGAPGRSRVGGAPDLAAGEGWPHNPRGIPMVCLAQIDCSALPAIDPPWGDGPQWAHDGRLVRLFADLMDSPYEPCRALALVCDPDDALSRASVPPIPDPWPAGGPWDDLEADERPRALPETAVALVPFLTAAEVHPALRPELHDPGEPAERYDQWASRLRIDGRPLGEVDMAWAVSHLLGEASSVQDDVRATGAMLAEDEWGEETGLGADPALASEDAWRVLLGLHMGDTLGLDILDDGAYHVLAPVDDLVAGRLDRLVCAVDSG